MSNRHFRIWRGDAEGGQFVDYSTAVDQGMVVLDVLHRIQAEQAGDMAVRWNCKAGKCGSCSVEINGKLLGALDMLTEANRIAGRNGVGIANALENRIIGTKSRGVYEAPGMELLGRGVAAIYQAVLDRRSSALFKHLSALISDQIYDGRMFDPATRAELGHRWLIPAVARMLAAFDGKNNPYADALRAADGAIRLLVGEPDEEPSTPSRTAPHHRRRSP